MVDELYHLKFRADGFPDINYHFPDLEVNKAVLLSIDETFRETVEHWLFFPSIRKMGIDPASARKAAIRAGEYKTIDLTDVRNLAYRYYETKLLIDDATLVSQLAAWYKANGLTDALEKGEELSRLVTDSNPRTPEGEVSTYIKILNAVPESTARFQLESWKDVTLGTFRWRIVIIRISK